jgi:23S rRNA (adenine2503-C2)-methyltransferase
MRYVLRDQTLYWTNRVNLPRVDTRPDAAQTVPALLDLPFDQLCAWFHERGEPRMRTRQVRRWLLAAGVESFEQMTDLPKALRQELASALVPLGTRVVRHLHSADDTHKLLLGLGDGKLVECVLIQEDGRRTACISTQVGCGMGCVFCASGLNGVERNLTAGEILEQLVRLRNLPSPQKDEGGRMMDESDSSFILHPSSFQRLTHIVVMGMGEPLANLDNLLEALEVATAREGLGIGARHVTISTVGLPVKIRRLADLGKQYHLAVSLHAPSDALRTQVVPTNAQTGLAAILEAADYFHERTGRQVTYEYVLLGGLNDSAGHARELALLLRGRQAHVNVIPFNDVEGLPYRRPTSEALATFLAPLRQHGISVKVRKRKGSDIDAACGQLRRREENNASPQRHREHGENTEKTPTEMMME